MRGSIGGTTFARNRGGAYARNRTTPLNPSSARQSAVRAVLADLSQRWTNTLTQIQRDAWDLYADNVPLVNSLGEPRNVAGINMYLRSNTLLIDSGGVRVDDGPTIFNVGPTIIPTLVMVPLTNDFDITDLGTFVIPAEGIHIFIAQGAPQNAGVSFFRSPFRKAFGQLVPLVPPFPIIDNPLPFPISAGQADFMRTIAITPDGRVGAESVQRFLIA